MITKDQIEELRRLHAATMHALSDPMTGMCEFVDLNESCLGTIPSLLDEIERLQKENARLKKALEVDFAERSEAANRSLRSQIERLNEELQKSWACAEHATNKRSELEKEVEQLQKQNADLVLALAHHQEKAKKSPRFKIPQEFFKEKPR